MEWHFVLVLTAVASITLLVVVTTWYVFKRSANKTKKAFNQLEG
jgi:hypothetical protein